MQFGLRILTKKACFAPLHYLCLIYVTFLPLIIAATPYHEEAVIPYLMPEDLQLKKRLDKFFSKSRWTLSPNTLKKGGFENATPRKFTHVIVTKHPKFPGYIFKIYTDAQRYHKKEPEWHYWLLRVRGAHKIQKLIERENLTDYFAVPKKWIYRLPKHPSPPQGHERKDYILVAEDMDLLSEDDNARAWAGERVTPLVLEKLHFLLKKLGLKDCSKIDNIPFTTEGKIAFIDTQSYKQWPIRYFRLNEALSPEMKTFWLSLTDQ